MDDTSRQKARSGFVGWMKRHPKTTVLISLILLFAISLWVFAMVAEHRLAERIEAIRAKGEPMCVDDLRKLKRPGPNSLPDVLAITKTSQAIKLEDRSPTLPYLGTLSPLPTGCRLPDEQLSTARWYLDQLKDELPAMHAAMRRGKGTIDIQWTTPTINYMVPALAEIRTVAKIQMLEILVATEEGNARRVGELLVEHRYMLDLLGDDSMLLNMLVQVSLHAMYMDRVERTINRCGLEKSVLDKIQSAIAAVECLPDVSKVFIAERVTRIDSLDDIVSITGNAPVKQKVVPGTARSWSLVPGFLKTDQAVSLDCYAELIAAIRSCDRGLNSRIQFWNAKASSLPWYCVLTKIMVPAQSRSLVLWMRTIGCKRAMLVALAAERFRLDYDRWPATTSELVPKYLAAIPLDPIDDQPIRYALIPEGIKAWTISGDDADEDNGGDVQRIEPKAKRHRPTDFGWVILNPDLRGSEAESNSPATQPTTRPVASPSRD